MSHDARPGAKQDMRQETIKKAAAYVRTQIVNKRCCQKYSKESIDFIACAVRKFNAVRSFKQKDLIIISVPHQEDLQRWEAQLQAQTPQEEFQKHGQPEDGGSSDVSSQSSSEGPSEGSSEGSREDDKDRKEDDEDNEESPQQALMVVLAMSYERPTDVTRILALLKRYQFVIAASRIGIPSDPKAYGQLWPFVQSGRFEYVQHNFSKMLDTSKRVGLPKIFIAMQKHMALPKRIVCLDYFFLINTYYASNYGMNWLFDAKNKREGKARQFLTYATDVYLPVDKCKDRRHPTGMTAMLEEYARVPNHTMSITPVQSTPLMDSDLTCGDMPNTQRKGAVVSAQYMRDTWLDAKQPFIHIRLI
jgi:hypothetical protein